MYIHLSFFDGLQCGKDERWSVGVGGEGGGGTYIVWTGRGGGGAQVLCVAVVSGEVRVAFCMVFFS
jgi:hypothetical protein